MLYQYHGNDMEVLREAACTLFAAAPPPPLVPERLIVPNVGMAKWLRQGIAMRLGVAAHLDSALPASFLRGLMGAVLGQPERAAERAWSKEQLGLRLMRLLPALAEQPSFAAVRRYLAGVTPQRRLLALSRRLAALFDQYLLYRPHWLLAWEAGGNAPDCPLADNEWQAVLWTALVQQIAAERRGGDHGAARLQELIALLAGDAPLPAPLPERVIGFGLGALPPLFVEAIAALARRTDVHLFQFNPCCHYWYDIESERTLARWRVIAPERAAVSDTGNPLLATWGTLGKHGLQHLIAREPSEVLECHREPGQHTALAEIQRDILLLREPSAASRVLAAGERSLVFAEAHSALREVEALQDHLLDLLASLPGLQPRDITVMAPDIGAYAGVIDAVFAQSRRDPRYVPYSIADRDASAGNPVMQSFLHLLRLPESRFAASEVLALLGVPAMGERFGIDASALETIRGWVRDSGIRWGLDEHPSGQGAPGSTRNTWRFGLERMLLGIALDEGLVYEGATPFDTGGQDAIEQLGRLAEFVERLAHRARTLDGERTMEAWLELLRELIADFYAETPESAADLAELRAAIGAVAELLDESGFRGGVTREVLIDLLQERLAAREGTHQFLRGGVNFCQLTPLRSIPFRVVCLLGMNAEDFPRSTLTPAFDLMGLKPQPGDPSRRDDDRYLFLEALLSARDCFYLSYVARDERSNAVREPALPVSELRDYIDRNWQPGVGAGRAAAALTRRHWLKPFHPGYFAAAGSLFSYRHEWVPAARADEAAPAFCPEPLPAIEVRDLALTDLLRFFRNPCQGFFNTRLGIRFAAAEEIAEDCEPLALDTLAAWQVRDALLRAALAGEDVDARSELITASGTLPHGQAGSKALAEECAKVEDLIATATAWAELEPSTVEIALDVAGMRLHGAVPGLRGGALRQLGAGDANGVRRLQFWIQHLCCCAAGVVHDASERHHEDKVLRLPLLVPQDALAHLQDLVAIHAAGLRRPLPLFPKSAWAFVEHLRRKGDLEAARGKASKEFEDANERPGEGSDVYVRRAFPDADAALDSEFCALAERVFGPVGAALTEPRK